MAADLPGPAALAKWLRDQPQAPAVVMVSLPGCPICEIVRREQLAPMRTDPDFADVGVFEISMRDDDAVLPWRGAFTDGAEQEGLTPARLSGQLGIRVSPTLLFINRDDMLAEPLVGYPGGDFYWSYLKGRIDTARQRAVRMR